MGVDTADAFGEGEMTEIVDKLERLREARDKAERAVLDAQTAVSAANASLASAREIWLMAEREVIAEEARRELAANA
jgi:hypothetical protein